MHSNVLALWLYGKSYRFLGVVFATFFALLMDCIMNLDYRSRAILMEYRSPRLIGNFNGLNKIHYIRLTHLHISNSMMIQFKFIDFFLDFFHRLFNSDLFVLRKELWVLHGKSRKTRMWTETNEWFISF